jgi:recombinational DNA repair ATPase RecF
MLLDEAMSELDGSRRQLLIELLGDGGQSLITTTEQEHVPNCSETDLTRVQTTGGEVSPITAAIDRTTLELVA